MEQCNVMAAKLDENQWIFC